MEGEVRITVVVAYLLVAAAVAPVVAGTAGAHQLDGDDDGNLTDALDGAVSTTSDVVNNTTDTVEDTTEETTDTLEDTTEETLETTTDTLDDTTDTTTETVDDTTDETTDALEDAVTSTTTTLDRLVESQDELEDEGFPASAVATTATPTGTAAPAGAAADSDADGSGAPADDGTGGAETDARTLLAPSTSVPMPDAGATATGMAGLGAVGAGLLAVQPGAGSTLRGASSALREAGRSTASALERFVRTIAPLRYSRYDDSDPLEHDARSAVFDEIRAEPGTYLSAVAERADVPLSTARHHLKVLEREGLVEGTKVRGRRRLYPAHADGKALAAALSEPATADVLATLARLGPSSASAIADEVDVTVSTVSHHLSRLEEDGLVEREREGQAVINRLPPEVAEAFGDDAGVEPAEEPAAVGAD